MNFTNFFILGLSLSINLITSHLIPNNIFTINKRNNNLIIKSDYIYNNVDNLENVDIVNNVDIVKNVENVNIVDIVNNVDKIDKIAEFKKLIRFNNTLPTFLINLFSGYITSSSVNDLILNKSFIVTCIVTQLIMYSSMIINDLFDIPVDKINAPLRPLVRQTIKIHEAIIMTILFYFISILLNNTLVYGISRNIANVSILLSILYTPIFKKIPFVKNLVCSFVVANTVLYSGLIFVLNSHYNKLLFEFTKLIFTASLYIEILQDVKDYDGDRENNINTLPVIFVIKKAVNMVFFLTSTLILDIILNFLINKSPVYNLLFIVPIVPLTINLANIKTNCYSQNSISKALNETTKSLIILLFIIFYIKHNLIVLF